MLTNLQNRLKRAGRLLPLALLPFAAHAQFNYVPTNAVNTAGTYTDLGTSGTVITTANTDDANSAAQPIGFTFTYNGTAFTQFVLNTNGLIRLGAAAPSVANIFLSQDQSPTQTAVDPVSSTNAANVNLIMPFNTDLVSGTSPAEYRVSTTGTSPNRVCTIQWANVSDKTGTGTDTAPTQYTNFSFQAKLYETTNNIEFVYGPATASTNAATSRFPTVGIKGADAASAVLGNKTTGAAAWSTTVFINGPYTTTTHNFRNATLPDLGRTYRFVAAPLCADPTAATISATNNSITLTFTPGASNVSYNVTYSTGGTAQTLTPTATASPITITGLLPGTTYYVTLQSVCSSGSSGGVLRGSVATTGTPPAATYATLPYTESFEGPWVNGLSTRDLPTANWRNSPATGDNSWRRDDDGASANWRYLPGGGDYTPAFSTGAHSARFHTYGTPAPTATNGVQPSKLDLYVNMSGSNSKVLNFDYINPTGTDKLDVLLSTDGGATFATSPLLTATTSVAFSTKSVTIPSTSATTVIRFQATSDFGDDDLGIDNLRLSVVTATSNAALAATVSLYPNPTHQSFQLTVPTGLRAASATLSNSLGQVVQSRQLNLPAAGTTDFNVSSLAPGVYTLTLKSGADLVVKRVVVE
ncbi:hypothetical protein GCM10028822_34210 [Hymenobacter terrigena]